MTTSRLLLTAWDFDPSVIVGCALLLGVYLWRVRGVPWTRKFSYVAGVLILFLSIESPIDTLGDTYLFSAHMVQHLLMILIVPPLMLYGIPESEVRSWLRRSSVARAEAFFGRPWIAWILGMGVMTIWHLPVLYNFALAHEPVHIFQHLTFLITGTMFWWPVMSPLPERRLEPVKAIFYLFAAVVENTMLGILITFMPVGYYTAYLHPADPLGALHLIRDQWEMSAASDQKLGGLFMWIPGCSVYFVAILAIVVKWYDNPDDEERMSPQSPAIERMV